MGISKKSGDTPVISSSLEEIREKKEKKIEREIKEVYTFKTNIMKNSIETILFIIAAVVGIVLPEYGNVSALTAAFVSVPALVGFIIALTTLTKNWIGYDGSPKWQPKAITVGWSLVLGFISFFSSFGLYAIFEAWYEVAIAAVVFSGLARDFYNLDFALTLVKLFTGQELEEENE